MRQNLLSQRCMMIWRLRATSLLILYAFLDGGLFVFFPGWAVTLGLAGGIAYVVGILVYLPMLYRHCGYFYENGILSIESGVLIHHRTKIPVSRIQYCVISQGPVQRIFGLCSVRLLLAGSFESVNQITLINGYRLKNGIEASEEHHGKEKI